MSKDADYRRMINSMRWKRLRKAMIESRLVCERCGLRGSAEVHHVRPVEWARTPEEKERRMFDPGNLQCLCRECHRQAHLDLRSHSLAKMRASARRRSAEAAERMFGRKEDPRDAGAGGGGEGPPGGHFFKGGGGR